MAKKIIHIILTTVLILGTAGMALHKHYSNGDLYSISIFGETKSCCADNEICVCCSTKTEFYQVEDDFNSSSFELPQIACLLSLSDHNDEILENIQTSLTASLKNRYLFHAPHEIDKYLAVIQVYLI